MWITNTHKDKKSEKEKNDYHLLRIGISGAFVYMAHMYTTYIYVYKCIHIDYMLTTTVMSKKNLAFYFILHIQYFSIY